MKKIAGLALLVSVAAAPSLWAAGIDFKPFFGKIDYREHARQVMTLDSDWEALLYGIKVELNEFHYPWLGGAIEGTIFGSDVGLEEWDGWRFHQTNDLNVWGMEGKALLGINIPIKDVFMITPLGGLSYRYQKFTRKNFTVNDLPSDLDPVTEKCPLFCGVGGINATVSLTRDYQLFGRFLYSYVIASRAENSLIGEIKGEHGNIYTAEAGMQWTDGACALGCGIFYERQELDGGLTEDETVEWPENTLESVAAMGTFRFFF